MNRTDSTWCTPDVRAPWATPDADRAPVCFVKQMPGDLRITHVVTPDDVKLVPEARELMAALLRHWAVVMDEPIGEGRTYVLRDAYQPGWHIVCAEAPRVPSWH